MSLNVFCHRHSFEWKWEKWVKVNIADILLYCCLYKAAPNLVAGNRNKLQDDRQRI